MQTAAIILLIIAVSLIVRHVYRHATDEPDIKIMENYFHEK